MQSVAKNERYFDHFSIFETAKVFRDRDYTSPNDEREKLPYEHKNIAGAVAAVTKDVTELFRQAKGIVEMMPRYTHMEGFTFRQVSKPSWADNVVWMNIYCGDEQVGNLALLSKRASMDCGIKNLSVMLFELDQELLKPLRSRTNTFTHMPEYPVADYDVSVLLDREVKWEAVREAILGKHTGGLLKDAAFVDEYRGKQVPDGKKSVTIRLTIGSQEKTLTSAEIEECASSALHRLVKKLGAELRSR